jgi:hypothetical protein
MIRPHGNRTKFAAPLTRSGFADPYRNSFESGRQFGFIIRPICPVFCLAGLFFRRLPMSAARFAGRRRVPFTGSRVGDELSVGIGAA